MAKDLWLPKGYELPDGSKVRLLVNSSVDWQIFETDGSGNILLTSSDLVGKWNEFGFLDESLFEYIVFGNESYRGLISHKKYVLSPVECGKSPERKVDAIAFAFALKESRKVSDNVCFSDAVYIEQFTRLLPSFTLSPLVADEVVLGTWLTGGVAISTDSFRRLSNLTGWMPTGVLVEVLDAAGFVAPADAGILANRKSIPQPLNGTKCADKKDLVEFEQSQSVQGVAGSKTFNLPGRPELEVFFNEHVIDIIFNAEKYRALGINFPSAIVLHGPPGCGKTFAVEKLVEFIDWPSFSIDSSSVGSPYIHETSKKISQVFDTAIDSAPSVIIIDEMESFLTDRNSGSSSGLHHIEEVAEFLRRIPEAIKSNVLIIAMTNMIEMIDPAILRRGRFDHIVEVGMPSRAEVSSLVDSLLSNLPICGDLNLDEALDALTGKALSDSAFIIREAARLAAKSGKTQLDQESIDAALKSLPSNTDKKSRRIGFVWDDG